MDFESIIVDAEGPTLYVRMNRPDKRNALSTTMLQEMKLAVENLSEQKSARCLIIEGEGPAFCSGADLDERASLDPEDTNRHRELALQVVKLIERFPTPVIAACRGATVAGGMEIALAADIRVASRDSHWSLPEVRVVGGFPGVQGPIRLQKYIGSGAARLFVFTGDSITGEEAYRLGIVDVLCDDDVRQVASAIASRIARNSPLGIRAVKQLMVASVDLSVDAATHYSRALRTPLDHSSDRLEGLHSWREGREPRFD